MSNPRDLERLARNINPGGWAIETDRPIATLLGSCVAVCLWDPKLRVGGLNHFMLPKFERSANKDLDMLLCGNYCMEAPPKALPAAPRRSVCRARPSAAATSSRR